MTISNQDEYELPSGEIISIQFSIEGGCWEVACWRNDEARWYKEYSNEEAARKEYDRWKINK